MNNIKEILETLMQISLGFTSIQVYLQINKIWKRKHDKEVAESQSITGLLILFFNCILSISYYLINQNDMISAAETSIYLFQALVLGLISTGIFIKGREKMNFISLIKRAFKLERKEADYLLKKFFKPANADIIISILHQIAMIDDHLDPKEEELILAFAKEWKIDYSVEKLNKERFTDKENNFVRLRKSVEDYLSSEPPREQAAQLKDMMHTLINADDEVAPEEELIAAELMGLITNFLNSDSKLEVFDVLIVPQNQEHHKFIHELMPNAKQFEVAGGMAYSMGSYYSHKYAEMICNQYREINLFTIVHNPQN